MKPTILLLTALLLVPPEASIARANNDATEHRYDFYQPQVKLRVLVDLGSLRTRVSREAKIIGTQGVSTK